MKSKKALMVVILLILPCFITAQSLIDKEKNSFLLNIVLNTSFDQISTTAQSLTESFPLDYSSILSENFIARYNHYEIFYLFFFDSLQNLFVEHPNYAERFIVDHYSSILNLSIHPSLFSDNSIVSMLLIWSKYLEPIDQLKVINANASFLILGQKYNQETLIMVLLDLIEQSGNRDFLSYCSTIRANTSNANIAQAALDTGEALLD